MDIVTGLALLALTGYASCLSYSLRTYSRARLAENYLSEQNRRVWIEWLDRHETGLQLTTSFLRLATMLLLAVYVYFKSLPNLSDGLQPADYWLPPLIILAMLVVFAIGVPNAIAIYAGEAVLARSLRVLWAIRVALWPVERLLIAVDFVVRRLLGKPEPTQEQDAERMEQEILEAVSEGEWHGAFDEEQKEMIESVFALHETPVSQIMTPRTDIVAIPADASFDLARRTIVENGHSRLPVYHQTLDHVVGVLYAKDLLRLKPTDPFDATRIMRTAPYVPATKTLDELLEEFRNTRVQIAIVLDEYGGTAGLVTLEDILEELVGEIDDEYDQAEPPAVRRIDADTLEVDARAHIHEVNEALEVELPENDEYATIGGFVFSTLGKIPAKGEEFTHENVHFHVVDAEPRKINRLRIRVQREAASA
ncbi:MAG: hemolysin family protein [Phycisphaerae bacterium]|nr:HlyC/CorC family transporter [Phycisphaerae bacterium]MCZ2399406.1 hemolysin family protein [Phycisphaerae bacterium]NUQ49301.1 HlyC/CorC family transporter [Phycisphaerae bacterium]